MKAWGLDKYGTVQAVLKQLEVADPTPAADEVLIRVSHSSVNPVDWKICEGLLQNVMPYEFPIVLGWEAAGTVESVGANVCRFKPGERVFACTRKDSVHDGGFAEFVVVKESAVALIPDSIDFAQAGAISLAALTAWQALGEITGLKAGEKVLITAGAGGVGSFAIQIAKHLGARVVATAGTLNQSYILELGTDRAVDYSRGRTVSDVTALVPGGVDVVFDCAGGAALEDAWKLIKPNGRLVSIATMPGQQKPDVKASYHLVRPNGAQLATIADLLATARMRLPTIVERSLKDLPALLEQNKLGHTRGKVSLKVEF